MRLSSRLDVTVDNYENYLRPWVRWLRDSSDRGVIHVTQHVLKLYLDKRYLSQQYDSYARVGKQIAHFVNRYLAEKITMIAPLSHQRNYENVQMPELTLRKLMAFTRK